MRPNNVTVEQSKYRGGIGPMQGEQFVRRPYRDGDRGRFAAKNSC
jgi:hypothetical protein